MARADTPRRKNTLYKKRQAEIWVNFFCYLRNYIFELDPNKVCQTEALAIKRTLNMFLRRVGGDNVVKNPPKVKKHPV